MRPLLGITSYAEQASWGAWTLDSALLPLSYVRAVESAGGRPLLLPPVEDGVDETLEALDGLILSGGADVDPGRYGAGVHAATGSTQPGRDRAELTLLRGALSREMPVLAICRGMQVMNVLHGGDLHQHLPELVGHNGHRQTPGVFSEHEVTIQAGSRLGRVLGTATSVKSHHHQGVGRVGAGLEVVARASDGSVEGIEDSRHRFAVGVLWHPEEGEDLRLFAALVEEACAYRARRRP